MANWGRVDTEENCLYLSDGKTIVGRKEINDPVNHPSHYTDGNIEVIDFIFDKGLGRDFCLGNAIKYISRAGKKDPSKEKEDLMKARWYLDRYIKELEDTHD